MLVSTITLLSSPSPKPSETGTVGSSFSPALITVIGTITAALIAGAFAVYQRWKNQRLEDQKLDLERQKLEWEREKLQLTWSREKELDDEERRKEEDRIAREEERIRLAAEAESDTIKRGEAAYCIKLERELGQLKILDMTRPLDLSRIYVQVQIRERMPLRYVDETELKTISAVSGESTSIQSDSDSPHDAGPVLLAPEDALRRYHRMAILGDPGAGKTTMLKHLAFQIIHGRHSSDSDYLPVFVELRRFVDSGRQSIIDYVRDLWMVQYGFAAPNEYIENRMECGGLVLLLDGLDEVLGERHSGSAESVYAAVSDEINRIAVRFPDCPLAVTCRRHGWREGLPAFQTMEALDFGWPQVTHFVEAWFSTRPGKGQSLLNALGRNQRLQALAANPLLLSLIAIVYEKDLELPERRSALYRRCCDVLLREWDSHRQIKRLSQFTTDRKEDLLKQLAWAYHSEGQRYFEADDLLRQIAQFLPSVDIDPSKNIAILDEIAAQYGLLKEQANGWYGFLHLTLQEHFAATALLERGQEGVEFLIEHRFDPWWEEVILLFAGATPDAGPLLRGIIRADNGSEDTTEPLTLRDDIFHSNLLLATRCLAGAPRIADVRLRQQIVNAVRTIALTANNKAEAKRAIQAFIEGGVTTRPLEELATIIVDSDVPIDNRRAIIESMAESRGPTWPRCSWSWRSPRASAIFGTP